MAIFSIETKKINECVNELDAFDGIMAKCKGELEDVMQSNTNYGAWYGRIQNSLKRVSFDISKERSALRSMKISLETIRTSYMDTEKKIENTVREQASGKKEAYDRQTRIYDDNKDNGSYGADQGHMKNKRRGIDIGPFHVGEDKKLYDFIRQQKKYTGLTDKEIGLLIDQIDKEGCGYVAFVNNIFLAYEGHEEEFEKRFGFPMYDENGNPNYDYLLVDFYAHTDDVYYMDGKSGQGAIVNDIAKSYVGREDQFREKYGCDLYAEGTKNYLNSEARERILAKYNNVTEAEYKVNGMSNETMENRVSEYLNNKGITHNSEIYYSPDPMSAAEVNSYINSGRDIAVCTKNFNMYDENNQLVREYEGTHWMSITGITEDGKYIVSSWGERYYLEPSEIKGDCSYYISNIIPG